MVTSRRRQDYAVRPDRHRADSPSNIKISPNVPCEGQAGGLEGRFHVAHRRRSPDDPNMKRRLESGALLATMKRRVRRRALVLTALLWTLHLSLLSVSSWLDRGETLSFYLGHAVSTAYGLLLCCFVYLVIERLHARSFRTQAVVLAVLVTAAAISFSIVRLYTHRMIGRQGAEVNFRLVDYMSVAGYFWYFFLAWSAIIVALIYSYRVEAEQTMRMEAQSSAHRAQLQALHHQINPHFLFNTLNSIAALVLDDKPKAAESMIRKIGDFLRRGLASDPFKDVTLRSEVEQQQAYLEIERIRFSDRLRVEIDVAEDLGDAIVPSLLLQPLVENAVKHGVSLSAGLTTIRIEAAAEQDSLSIKVTDDGAVASDERQRGVGIGLSNVEQRLAARFGEHYWFHAGPRQRGFEVQIRIPLRFAP
jgi:two-component system, LytTR family, sensor kinase